MKLKLLKLKLELKLLKLKLEQIMKLKTKSISLTLYVIQLKIHVVSLTRSAYFLKCSEIDPPTIKRFCKLQNVILKLILFL